MPNKNSIGNIRERLIERVGLLALFFCLFATGTAFTATPVVGTITPSSGVSTVNQAVTFTTTYTDADGVQDIRYPYFLVNVSTSSVNAFCAVYDQFTNKLYLRNDANTSWLGGIVVGTIAVIENSYAKLDCRTTTILKSANQLTVKWRVIFKSTFIGTKNTYLFARDKSGLSSGSAWSNKGIWTILPVPQITSMKPDNLSTFTVGDTIKISVQTNSSTANPLQYRYLMDNVVIKTWSNYASFSFLTASSNRGRHTIKVEARNLSGTTVSKRADTYIFRAFPNPQ